MAERYAGPPGSANGGYLSGRLAGLLDPAAPVAITLRRPPPLAVPLAVVPAEDGLRLEDHRRDSPLLLAEARPERLDVEPVQPVPYEAALRAEASYRGALAHPFPGCFVCGTARAEGDGLRLRPGPLADDPDVTACTWTPADSLAEAGAPVPAELVWAALDCPGGWTLDLPGRPMVLGRMTGQVGAAPRPGDRCIVMGRLLGQEGRKASTATTLYDEDGRALAWARAVWIGVDPALFAGT